jgi:hypothetical protein
MVLEVGQKLTLQHKKRAVTGEVIDADLLNPGDRKAYSKRDSNPIFKFTVRVPDLKLTLSEQIEMIDRIEDDPVKGLEEVFSNALAHGHGEPY